MTTTYRHLASEVGCLSAEIYKEIRRCLRLRGGVMHDGIKWIWKTSEELAERLGCSEKTIRRHLKHLVDLGWLKREQLQKRWGMRAYHYSLGDEAPLKSSIQSYSLSKPTADRQGSTKSGSAITKQSAQLVEHLHGMQGVRKSEPQEQRVFTAASAEMPLQSRSFVPSEADTMTASINRNTTSTNSPTGQNSLNSQGASRQTEKVPTGGDQSQESLDHRIHNPEVKSSNEQHLLAVRAPSVVVSASRTTANTSVLKRSSLYLHRKAEPVDALVSGTSEAPRVPSHWPEDGMTTSLKVQVIEAARQLAFPGRKRAFA